MNLHKMTKNLMKSLADTGDSGVSYAVYESIYDLAKFVFGDGGASILSSMVNATDDEFYIPENRAEEFKSRVDSLTGEED